VIALTWIEVSVRPDWPRTWEAQGTGAADLWWFTIELHKGPDAVDAYRVYRGSRKGQADCRAYQGTCISLAAAQQNAADSNYFWNRK
jgi:hypothetical protein